MSRKFPKKQRMRSILAHGLATQKQFKPQVIRNKRPELEDPELLAEIEAWGLENHEFEEAAEVDPEVFDNLLDPDWDL